MTRNLLKFLPLAAAAIAPMLAQTPAVAPLSESVSRGITTRDPSSVVQCEGEYWMFYTGRGVPSYHSKDLATWEPGPPVFTAPPEWAAQAVPENRRMGYWAPDVKKVGSRYLLYYSISSMGSRTSAIALATNPALDPDTTQTLTVTHAYDALNRVTRSTAPDSSVTTPSYNERSLLAAVTITIPATNTTTDVLTAATYTAKAQRETLNYGNGVTTTYTYDPDTFRLAHIKTTRPTHTDRVSAQIFTNTTDLQDIQYIYDPVGNITQTHDGALTTIFYNNKKNEYFKISHLIEL